MNNIISLTTVCVLLILFYLEGFSPHYKGRKNRFKHAFPNLGLGAISAIITAIFMQSVFSLVPRYDFGLLKALKLPGYLYVFSVFLIMDLWIYIWHRANHTFSFLWRFHKVHHVDPDMDSTTALLFHPIEMLLSMTAKTVIIVIMGVSIDNLVVYEAVFILVVIFHHSNIALNKKWDKILRSIIVTPDFHRVHHSNEYSRGSRNYASVFSFWDRIARTFRMRDTRDISLGIKSVPGNVQKSIKGMLFLPFIENRP